MTREEEIAKLEALLVLREGVNGYAKNVAAIKARLEVLRNGG